MLGMENLLDGGEPEILVQPAVAGDLVHGPAVRCRSARQGLAAGDGVGVRQQETAGNRVNGIGGLRLVVDEASAGGERCVSLPLLASVR